MKRIIAFIIAAVMCLALVSCGGSSEKEKLYDKYEKIIKALERENYEKAVNEIKELYDKAQETAETTEDPNEIAAIEDIPGEWIMNNYSDEEGLEKIVFNDDGTCVIGDNNYTWEITESYDNWYNADIKSGDTKEYSFNVNKDSDTGLTRASLYKYTDENSTEHITGYYNAEEYTAIEITAENFDDYFEDYEEITINKNSFDEIESMSVYTYKVLKEEYGNVQSDLSSVAVEYSYVAKDYELLSYDFENKAYTLGEVTYEYNGGEPYTNTNNMYSMHLDNDTLRYGMSFSSFGISEGRESVYVNEDFEIVRILGTIYTYNTAE